MKAILEIKAACNENDGPSTSLIYSGASLSPAANGWGGARNFRDRVSHHIALEAALELVDAARWAIAAGMPFNRHLTVHWGLCGLSDCDAAAATARLVKLISDWVRKRGGPFAYAWVREMGRRKGSHVHILLHIPKGIGLGHMTSRWARSILGQIKHGTIKTRSIGGSPLAAFSGSDWYEVNLARLVAYLLKGVSVEVGAALALDQSAEGGQIIGKRVSVSQNLRSAGRGCDDLGSDQIGERRKTSGQTLTQFISYTSRAGARARPEVGNQNFADDLGKSGKVA